MDKASKEGQGPPRAVKPMVMMMKIIVYAFTYFFMSLRLIL
jgi:hypothetical protein